MELRKRAFTLVELILTISVMGIIALAVGQLLVVGLGTYISVRSRSGAIQQARIAMDRMLDELQRLPATTMPTVSDTRIDFIDAQGIATNFKQITDATDINIVRGEDLLVNQAGYLDFDPLDRFGAPAADTAAVRRINIELNVLFPWSSNTITFRSELFRRAFMYQGFQ
ncbi:MAG: type II secretion system protein [Deltaproteobacteria bacterium]|nr:type II secretion system protein [Deltaproteobacteria bacterium]